MATLQPDLKDIVKEIKNLGNKIDKLEKIVETRLVVGEEIPEKYEKKALAEFERKRKTGKLEFLSLS